MNHIHIFTYIIGMLLNIAANAQNSVSKKYVDVNKEYFYEQLPISQMLRQLHSHYPKDTLSPHILVLRDSEAIYTYTPGNTVPTTPRLSIIPIWKKNQSCIYYFFASNLSPSYNYLLIKEKNIYTILNGHQLSTDWKYINTLLAKSSAVIELDVINTILSIYINNPGYHPHGPPFLRIIKYEDSSVIDSYYPPRVLPEIQIFTYPIK